MERMRGLELELSIHFSGGGREGNCGAGLFWSHLSRQQLWAVLSVLFQAGLAKSSLIRMNHTSTAGGDLLATMLAEPLHFPVY